MANLKFSDAQANRPADYVIDGSEAFGCTPNASGTGTNADGIGMTLAEIRMSIVSVTDYGAIGDGVADDTASINAAITDVGINGGTIYFPSGTYRITSDIIITVSNITLRFVEDATIFADDGSYTGAVMRINGTGGFVTNVNITGKGVINSNLVDKPALYIDADVTNCSISDIEITSQGSPTTTENRGILVEGDVTGTVRPTNIRINNVYIHGVYGEPLLLTECDDIIVSGCVLADIPTDSQNDLFEASNTNRVVVSDCILRNPGRTNAAIDIFANTSGSGTCTAVSVSNCSISCDDTISQPLGRYGVNVGGAGSGPFGVVMNNVSVTGIPTTEGQVNSNGFIRGYQFADNFDGDINIVGGSIVDILQEVNAIAIDNRGPGKVTLLGTTIKRCGTNAINAQNGHMTVIGASITDTHWGGGTATGVFTMQSTLKTYKILGCNIYRTTALAQNTPVRICTTNASALESGIIDANYCEEAALGTGANDDLWGPTLTNLKLGLNHTENQAGVVKSSGFQSGTETGITGATAVVAHNAGFTPNVQDFQLTPANNNDATSWWVSNVGSQNFTINCDPVTVGGADFTWHLTRSNS